MTPSAVTIRDHKDGQSISTFKSWRNGAVDAGIGWEPRHELWAVGIQDFPATELFSDDEGYALLHTAPREGFPDGLLVWVQTIDLEYLDSNDAWIDKYFNPVCPSCWYYTCQTILREGDVVGQAYSVRVVQEDQCETPFHNSDIEEGE